MKFLQFSIASAVALIFSGAALTQSPGMGVPATDPPATLGALDADRDGSISQAEAAQNPGLAGQFLGLDANFNGALEPAEFARFEALGADSTRGTPGSPGSPGSIAPAPGTGDPAGNMGMLDSDRSGGISRQEAAGNPALASQFLTLDSNGNGTLEPSEFSRFESTGTGTQRGTPGAPGSPQSPGAPGDSAPWPGATRLPPEPGTPAPDGTAPAPR